ncbi:hypothetical protein ILYODFUR_026065 [Ilyodon furcidens]|uniref:Uncharacterized protein n=1 Tax=Ilyodon furcidens TaxID=33524 RepID=A0ABV0TYY9_9TELE
MFQLVLRLQPTSGAHIADSWRRIEEMREQQRNKLKERSRLCLNASAVSYLQHHSSSVSAEKSKPTLSCRTKTGAEGDTREEEEENRRD